MRAIPEQNKQFHASVLLLSVRFPAAPCLDCEPVNPSSLPHLERGLLDLLGSHRDSPFLFNASTVSYLNVCFKSCNTLICLSVIPPLRPRWNVSCLGTRTKSNSSLYSQRLS